MSLRNSSWTAANVRKRQLDGLQVREQGFTPLLVEDGFGVSLPSPLGLVVVGDTVRHSGNDAQQDDADGLHDLWLSSPNKRMKLIGAAILVSRGMKVLQATPAAYPYR